MRSPIWRTADWGYLRLHEGTARFRTCYGRSALRWWAERIVDTWSEDEDVFVYFNNDREAAAPHDAMVLGSLLEDRDVRVA